MADNKEKVISWIRSGMDYNEGISLLIEITRKQFYFNQFTGGMRSMSGKLAWELCKSSGAADLLNWKQFIQDIKDEPIPDHCGSSVKVKNIQVPPKLQNSIQHGLVQPIIDPEHIKEETLEENPLKEYPAIIRRVMYEYASIFQERSKLHTVMTEMDSSNAPAVMIKRAELFDLIKALSDKLERFYLAKEKYELDGTIPIEDELFPPDPEQKQPEDISILDEEGLKNRKKNLQNGNSKDQSILDYQSAKHGSTKNPMPNGPKRIKIEYRIKQRNKQMEEIDTELLKYVIKQ